MILQTLTHHSVQDTEDYLEDRISTDAIIIDFSKAFDLVPHDRLLIRGAFKL